MEKVLFVGGTYILPSEAPHWSTNWNKWYVFGHRWIKSKKKFSTVSILHNFHDYEWIDESEIEK